MVEKDAQRIIPHKNGLIKLICYSKKEVNMAHILMLDLVNCLSETGAVQKTLKTVIHINLKMQNLLNPFQ